MPSGVNKYEEGLYELNKKERITVRINSYSRDTGKRATILSVPAIGEITTDTLVHIRMAGKIITKRIKALENHEEVIKRLNAIR